MFNMLTCFNRSKLLLICGPDYRQTVVFVHRYDKLNFTFIDEESIREKDLASLNEPFSGVLSQVRNQSGNQCLKGHYLTVKKGLVNFLFSLKCLSYLDLRLANYTAHLICIIHNFGFIRRTVLGVVMELAIEKRFCLCLIWRIFLLERLWFLNLDTAYN